MELCMLSNADAYYPIVDVHQECLLKYTLKEDLLAITHNEEGAVVIVVLVGLVRNKTWYLLKHTPLSVFIHSLIY